jgi:RB1-inducible coiled-coil protein 1
MRLKWIMYVENMMSDVGNRLMIYYEKLKRLRRNLDVIQQIHLSPQMYVSAVGEAVRRRTFSQAFLLVSYVTYMFIISTLCFIVVCLNQVI